MHRTIHVVEQSVSRFLLRRKREFVLYHEEDRATHPIRFEWWRKERRVYADRTLYLSLPSSDFFFFLFFFFYDYERTNAPYTQMYPGKYSTWFHVEGGILKEDLWKNFYWGVDKLKLGAIFF